MSEVTKIPTPSELILRAAGPVHDQIKKDLHRKDLREGVAALLRHILGHLFDSRLNVGQARLACDIRDNSVVMSFRQQLGVPPKQYITERRMEVAIALLRDSHLRIWQISDLLGYSALGVFSKAFRRWGGMSPTEFRQTTEPERAPRIVFDAETIRRALGGDLSSEDASVLIGRLIEQYPGVSTEVSHG